MKKGIIRRRGSVQKIGEWRADLNSLMVETEDPDLRKAADEILKTPQSIPVHAAERHAGLSYSEQVIEPPAKLKYLGRAGRRRRRRRVECPGRNPGRTS